MSVADDLKHFGAPKDNVRLLDGPRWSNVDYHDLIQGIALERGGERSIKPAAVVEANGEPLLYVVPTTMLHGQAEQARSAVNLLRVKLSTRGTGAYVALSEPGKLTLYSVGLDPQLPPPIVRTVQDDSAVAFFSELASGLTGRDLTGGVQEAVERAAFRDKLFRLLTETSKELLKVDGLKGNVSDVISLVGRALFARFLIDRGVLTRLPTGAAVLECFAGVANAAATCAWMDEEFNGDLLELGDGAYLSFFRRLGARSEAFPLLTNIVKGQEGGQFEFPLWGEIDFSHVPVGLLSEVYERLAHDLAGDDAAAESIHYTPRHIAAYMVDQAFSGLPKAKRAGARCLDPAAGGGVFLVLCYRRLVSERWRADGEQPTRKVLREIIENQVRGFDINESALKLAALSLYLSAIELDPDPRKAGGRKFKPMLNRVLLHVRGADEPHPNSYILGSLGPAVDDSHLGRYQIIIGNPPWSSWSLDRAGDKRKDLKRTAEAIVRRVAASRAITAPPTAKARLKAIVEHYEHPDYVPDLPFAWRAMEWAAPGGVIALALHGRLLFTPAAAIHEGRNALFSALRVTGVVNGSMLRLTPVWPKVLAQWCLVFGLNEVPVDQHTFYYVNPERDPPLNAVGRLRVDYHSAQPIELGVLLDKPTLLKTLVRGTSIDASILERVVKVGVPLQQYFDDRAMANGDGYQVYKGGVDSDFLLGMPNLTRKTLKDPRKLDVDALPKFDLPTVHRKRRKELYAAPLLLVPEALPSSREEGGVLVATKSVAFSESFYGYSAAGYDGDAVALVRYLHVLCHSTLLYHFAVMTSAKFGIERDLINKHDLDNFPIVPLETLSDEQRRQAISLSLDIEQGRADFVGVDRWVAGIYGLEPRDALALRDAFDTAMPFTASQDRALRSTTGAQRDAFVDMLRELLPPLFQLIDQPLSVGHVQSPSTAWKFVHVSAGEEPVRQWQTEWIAELGKDEGASAVFVHHGSHLIIGLRDQYRYWTPTRARLLAHEIVNKHADALFVAPAE